MNRYVDDLMTNHMLESSSDMSDYSTGDTYDNILKGGGDSVSVHKPTGGFPPIYLCSLSKEKKRQPVRAFGATTKSSVSIKDIMEQRRKGV